MFYFDFFTLGMRHRPGKEKRKGFFEMEKRKDIEMKFYLSDDQAIALAQMLKRLTFTHYQELSSDTAELSDMMTACYKLADELRYNGIDPR